MCQNWLCRFLENVWLDDLWIAELRDRLKVVVSPDIILCGWLGSKYQLTEIFSEEDSLIFPAMVSEKAPLREVTILRDIFSNRIICIGQLVGCTAAGWSFFSPKKNYRVAEIWLTDSN